MKSRLLVPGPGVYILWYTQEGTRLESTDSRQSVSVRDMESARTLKKQLPCGIPTHNKASTVYSEQKHD